MKPKESVQPVPKEGPSGWSQFEEWAGQRYFTNDPALPDRPKLPRKKPISKPKGE